MHELPEHQHRSVDWLGTSILTAALILLVYALSDSSDVGRFLLSFGSISLLLMKRHLGWGSPRIITTLVLSVALIVAFFVVEYHVPYPAVPPSTWTNKNFIPLFFYAWSIYWFALGSELNLVHIFMVPLPLTATNDY